MRRKIIFRGRDKDGSWVYGDLIHGQGKDRGKAYIRPCTRSKRKMEENLTGEYVEVSIDTIGQCSGMRDKDGNFIFEGDALVCTETMSFFEMIYVEGTFTLYNTYLRTPYIIPAPEALRIGEFKKAGNVYDSPWMRQYNDQGCDGKKFINVVGPIR